MKNQKTLIAFKKAASHLNNIVKMMEADKYCVDIMQQNLAVIGLLKSAHQQLMEGHLNACFTDALMTNNNAKKEKMVKEILTVSKLNNR